MITAQPVVITVAFIGFLVAGLAGSIMASIGMFLPVYLFTIIPAPGSNAIEITANSRPSWTAPLPPLPARSQAQ